MKTKITPGIWEQSHRKGRNGMYSTEVYSADTKKTIATLSWYAMPPQRELIDGEYKLVTRSYREANAQLISAAPDLFEALLNIENDDNRIPATIWEMRNKALNKALGEEVFKTKTD